MKQQANSKVMTFKRSTVVIAAIVAVLLMIATGVTVGLVGRGYTTAESVRPEVRIAADSAASDLTASELSTVDLLI